MKMIALFFGMCAGWIACDLLLDLEYRWKLRRDRDWLAALRRAAGERK